MVMQPDKKYLLDSKSLELLLDSIARVNNTP